MTKAKRFSRVLAFALTMLLIALVMAFANVSFASNFSLNHCSNLYVEGIQPRVPTACSLGNGIHQMARRGNGFVYSGSATLIDNKFCWQCTNCYTVIITSDDPVAYGGKVGYFATAAASEPVSVYFTAITLPNGAQLDYWDTKSMPGFRFFNG